MLFLNKSNSGYGWYIKVPLKDRDGNVLKDKYGKEMCGFMNFSFKKDDEPTNLGRFGSYEGDLYFIDKDGNKRKAYPIAHEYNGKISVELKLLEPNKEYDTKNFGGDRADMGESINIEQDELPFY